MDNFCLFGFIMLVGQLLINGPGMFDQFKKIRSTRQVDNISLQKWVYVWITLAAGAIHTLVERPNLYLFIPILPGLLFTTIILWQLFHYRHRPSAPATSHAK